MKNIVIQVDDQIIEMSVEGDTFFGAKEVLLSKDDDLSEGCSWHSDGYIITTFLTQQLNNKILYGVTKIIKSIIEEETGQSIPEFTLEKYHNFCKDNTLHLKVIDRIQKKMPLQNFPVNYELLDKEISAICGKDVTSNHPTKEVSRRFYIRIVRPQKLTDNNPPHRDVWLDRLRDAVNIYLPLSGSNAKSSLPLIPGSHLWSESDIERTIAGAKVNNVSFTVPCVVGSKYGLKMVRPNVSENMVMVFSPYLIHGGGCNLNQDVTRVSIEIRFWRKP